MKIVQEVKKKLKKNKQYSLYKKTFKNKQMRFLLTKLDSIFSSSSDPNALYSMELEIMNGFEDENAWKSTIINLSSNWLVEYSNIDWMSFGSFLFYIYHYSEFYIRKSKIKNNLYKINDFVEVDDQKRKHYNEWLRTMYESNNDKFNNYIIRLLEIIK